MKSGSILFDGDERRVHISFKRATRQLLASLPFTAVMEILDRRFKPPSVLLLLAYPPRLSETHAAPAAFDVIDLTTQAALAGSDVPAGMLKEPRLAAFSMFDEDVVPFVGSILRLELSTDAALNDLIRRRSSKYMPHFPPVIPRPITIRKKALYSLFWIIKLERLMSELVMPLTFQMQLLLSNGILVAAQLLSLEKEFKQLASDMSVEDAEKVIVLFAEHQSTGSKLEPEDWGAYLDTLEERHEFKPPGQLPTPSAASSSSSTFSTRFVRSQLLQIIEHYQPRRRRRAGRSRSSRRSPILAYERAHEGADAGD